MTDTDEPETVAEAKAEAESLEARAATFASIDPELADSLREEATELEERIEATRERTAHQRGVQALVNAAAPAFADGDASDLSEDEREEVESLAARAATFDAIDADHAEALRAEAVDIAGVDDFENIEAEVL